MILFSANIDATPAQAHTSNYITMLYIMYGVDTNVFIYKYFVSQFFIRLKKIADFICSLSYDNEVSHFG